AFFLGGAPKTDFIKAFGAHMFFDDKEEYCKQAAKQVPTGRVLLPVVEKEQIGAHEIEITVNVETNDEAPEQVRFLRVCRTYLRRNYAEAETELRDLYEREITPWAADRRSDFIDELELSVKETPAGKNRRAANA